MSTSTAPHDLAGIKHALELGLVLTALVLAAAAHGGTRLAADFTAAPGIAAMHTRGIATLRLNLSSTGHELAGRSKARRAHAGSRVYTINFRRSNGEWCKSCLTKHLSCDSSRPNHPCGQSLQRLRESMAITSSCSTQKGYWLLSLSPKRLKAGMKSEIEFRMDDQAVLFA
jgi:hypothetical protein